MEMISNTMPKSEFSEDLLACIGCLRTNSKFFKLNDEITDAYKLLTGMCDTSDNGVPQYICSYCNTLLMKYMMFRECCRNARYILHDAKMRDETITTDYLNDINHQLQDKYCQTKVKMLSIHENCVTFDDLSLTDTTSDEYRHHHTVKCDVSSPEYCQSDVNVKTYDNSSQESNITDRCDDEIIKCDTYEYCENDDKIFTHSFIKIENTDDIIKKVSKSKKNNPSNIVKAKSNNRKLLTNVKKSNVNNRSGERKSNDIHTFMQKGKYFETKENMEGFEREYDVDIITLSKEQQLQDVLDRKLSINYQHSPYKCELCYKGFMEENVLKKHKSSQHNPTCVGIVCEFCQFGYKDRRALTQHLRKHRLRFACRHCKYVSRTTFNAKEHHKTHGGHLYECKHCGKSYENISSHLSHMRLHHPAELMWCEICGESFIGQFGLNAHKKRAHKDLSLPCQCPTCDRHFASATALRNHAQQSLDSCATVGQHSSDSCATVGQQSRDWYATCRDSCVHCGECFNDAMQLKDHLLTIHRNTKVYDCEKCAKSFSHESQYRAHYRRMHVDSDEMKTRRKARPWVCEVCGKTCPTKCRLVYHQRTHTGDRPYACKLCSKSFTMKRLLQSHLKVHTNDRPYTCDMCPKTFKRLPALRNHERIHLGGQVKTSRIKRMPT